MGTLFGKSSPITSTSEKVALMMDSKMVLLMVLANVLFAGASVVPDPWSQVDPSNLAPQQNRAVPDPWSQVDPSNLMPANDRAFGWFTTSKYSTKFTADNQRLLKGYKQYNVRYVRDMSAEVDKEKISWSQTS